MVADAIPHDLEVVLGLGADRDLVRTSFLEFLALVLRWTRCFVGFCYVFVDFS